MTTEQETTGDLQTKLAKLIGLAGEAVKSGNQEAVLDIAGEISSLKKSIETVQKAEKSAKVAQNQAEISTILNAITDKFEDVYKGLKADIKRLVALGHDVEVVKFIVDVQNPSEKSCQVGSKTKARVAGTGGNKSKRTVTLADGSNMSTRDFVDAYATDEERASKTFESWPTALAEKVAKRVGATISQ